MSASERRLEQAAAQLRSGEKGGLAASAGRVLRKAVRAPRRTSYVRLTGAYAGVRIATSALRTVLAARLDGAIVEAAVQELALGVEDGLLVSVDLELVVRFGTYIEDVAHLARTQVAIGLTELLGADDVLPAPTVTVRVVDVTAADPRTTAPQDE